MYHKVFLSDGKEFFSEYGSVYLPTFLIFYNQESTYTVISTHTQITLLFYFLRYLREKIAYMTPPKKEKAVVDAWKRGIVFTGGTLQKNNSTHLNGDESLVEGMRRNCFLKNPTVEPEMENIITAEFCGNCAASKISTWLTGWIQYKYSVTVSKRDDCISKNYNSTPDSSIQSPARNIFVSQCILPVRNGMKIHASKPVVLADRSFCMMSSLPRKFQNKSDPIQKAIFCQYRHPPAS
ncbi:hypothetical protein BCR42DRAFT_392562 [Absidia repens]|uniref:Uncharacterized protein n=1 Tax=Absidia repens TaxID=90262 RepID=A0A1X2IFH0_9FUNG|nr:hypothetical protein BCR42DRAFT_392562 [Absidia repens]